MMQISQKKYEYNTLEGNIFEINEGVKEKKKDYGYISLQKSQINNLVESINLMSSSPNISSKFSAKIEHYLIPRFNEILGIISINKTLPEDLILEMSKENQKEIIKGLGLSSVVANLTLKKINIEDLIKRLKDMKMEKYKG